MRYYIIYIYIYLDLESLLRRRRVNPNLIYVFV